MNLKKLCLQEWRRYTKDGRYLMAWGWCSKKKHHKGPCGRGVDPRAKKRVAG